MVRFLVKKQLLLFILFYLFSCASIQASKSIKILALGNSFSVDAIESYLSDLAQADGEKIIIGNATIGGCSFEMHWNNAYENKPTYRYAIISEDGTLTFERERTLLSIITAEEWDIITFQQASTYSGVYETYVPYLSNLLDYVKKHVKNSNVQYALHMTWAYAEDATHKGFAKYDNDQLVMYNKIVDSYSRAAKESDIDIVIPVGTAIQNGRTSVLGDVFCRDGYHLSEEIGKYTASCTWYEKLLGKSVVGNPFIPANMSKDQCRIAQEAATKAVTNPYHITHISY